LLVLASVLTLLTRTGLRLLEPWPLKFVFDWVLGASTCPSTVPGLDALDPIAILTLATLALVAIVGLRAFVDYMHNVSTFLVSNRVLMQMRNELYRHLQGLPLSFHTKARSGELILRLLTDVTKVRDVAIKAFLPLLADLLGLVGGA
jgi:ATP-binding cassette subfamily B protein